MLENVNLKRHLPREDFARLLPGLQRRLFDLEKACWDQKIPSIIVLEGWDASGKGTAIAAITQRLDPRGFKVHSIQPPRTFEQEFPWLWRFWLKVPSRGEMAIFDRSWYSRVLEDRVDRAIPRAAWRSAFDDIVDFERMLADDGTVIIKFFLHINKKEQKRRFTKLQANPLEAWRVTKHDLARHRHYEQFIPAIEEMLARTEAEFAPWTIVEATSRCWAQKRIFETIIGALERRLGSGAPSYKGSEDISGSDADLRAAMDSLDTQETADARDA